MQWAGLLVAVVLAFLGLAWRFDNRSGTLFVLAILFLFVLAVPVLLLTLMAVML
ncbi:hypothetical protein [Allosphingosinicella indica]|uniref:Uncharacterized protein n=1 Tax=Allosphingosinicella indica TaxID=941907 RepID=A0A1X7GVJ9_9SPHN|nr:hypothetical protein [Allosphingosinicella indica]SMF74641.1 hypothetical protein SAMN06295910_2267 [Allosphingosinicella indica]